MKIAHRTATFALTLSLTVLIASVAQATPVKVDINAQGGPTAAGWTGWDPPHSDGTALNESNTFATASATDGTVDVQLTTAGHTFERWFGVTNTTGAFSAATPAEMWQELVYYNNALGAPFAVILDDLSAGTYEFTIYGYNNSDGDDIQVTTDIFVDGVDSGLDARNVGRALPLGSTYPAAFVEANGAATVSFVVANDNDTVTIEYRNPIGGRDFGMSGFQLNEVVGPVTPEPSAIVLTVLGIAGLLSRRRRRAGK